MIDLLWGFHPFATLLKGSATVIVCSRAAALAFVFEKVGKSRTRRQTLGETVQRDLLWQLKQSIFFPVNSKTNVTARKITLELS